MKYILSPTLKGVLVININPAIAFPSVFIEANPIMVPPIIDRNPVNVARFNPNCRSIIVITIRVVPHCARAQ